MGLNYGGVDVTVSDGASATPAGWYPDPADPARLRRWDGTAWTADVTLLAPSAPAPTPPPVPTPEPQQVAEPEPELEPEKTQESTAIPDWANLPGITLPPDLSSIPGFSSNPGLAAPAFDDPGRQQPAASPLASAPPPGSPNPAVSAPIVPGANGEFPTRRQLRELRELRNDGGVPSTPDAPAAVPSTPTAAADSAPYAPPPSGVQYIAPQPPGVPYTPPAESARPASDFGMPAMTPLATNRRLEPVVAPPLNFDEAIAAPSSVPPSQQPQMNTVPLSAPPQTVIGVTPGTNTAGAWLIALLPALQFAVLYVVFSVLGKSFLPGTQWGILAAPAVFSLIFAVIDRRSLLARGHHDAPSAIWAIIPPLYLIVRCVRLGRSALAPLITWVVLQVAAAVGVSVLLSSLVASVVGAG